VIPILVVVVLPVVDVLPVVVGNGDAPRSANLRCPIAAHVAVADNAHRHDHSHVSERANDRRTHDAKSFFINHLPTNAQPVAISLPAHRRRVFRP
jgi:hypothetical protein